MKKTVFLILTAFIALSFASCSSVSGDEPSMELVREVFSSGFSDDMYYADNQTISKADKRFGYMNNFEAKQTEWFFSFISADESMEIAVVKVKNERYLNTAKQILENHLNKNADVSDYSDNADFADMPDSETSEQPETSVFIYRKYAVLFKSADVLSLKNNFFTFMTRRELPVASTELTSYRQNADESAMAVLTTAPPYNG